MANIRDTGLAAAFLGMLVMWMTATANASQSYPIRPVRIVTPLSIGSQVDITGRMLAQKLSEAWGQPVIMDNRPGGAGGIAGNILVKSVPDGYTLMVYSDGHAVNAALNASSLPFDTLRDIARVSMIASMPSILVVAPGLGVRSVKDLVSLAKAKPGQLSFGSAGIGGGLHFSGELFKLAAGIEAVHVPFKGTPESVAETMTGRIQYMFSSPAPAMSYIRTGKLLALAVGSAQRSPAFPDVPTVAEAGVPGFEYDLWQGLFAPARTSRAIIHRINKDVAAVMTRADIREKLLSQSLIYNANTPEEFDRFVHAEVKKLTHVVKVAGMAVR
jgi:tripartite-type tricarboxylate transporter receptor subunit TctC